MKKVLIVTDSNSGITQKEGKEMGIFVIPMPFTINDEEYLEDITITQDEFYKHLAQNADVKTSQPSQMYLEETWDELLKTNDELVYIPMSSGLSGTCENAKVYAEKYDGKVQVVDNLRISISQKMSVWEAVKMVKLGMSAKQIKEYLEQTKDKASIYIIMGVLKYLRRGGRISPAAAALGDMLKLKPILYSRGGAFEKFAMTMSFAQAKKKILQKFRQELETEFRQEYNEGKMYFGIAHTQIEEEALKFKAEIEAEFPGMKVVMVDPLSLSVSCHIGPGSLGVGIFVNNFND